MPGKRILLVVKTALADRLNPDEIERLAASGAADADELFAAAAQQAQALATVRAVLARETVSECRVERLHPGDARDADLVVTIGGDGTVFTANTLATDIPFITVNSDPGGSVGNYTRAIAGTFPALFDAWLAGRHRIEEIPRLELRLGGASWRFLNDCLFTSINPAAMCRYVLAADGVAERQRSSGVWVSTAAGSTGAIRSAGMQPVPCDAPALLYKVREAFQARGVVRDLDGCQSPPRGLALTTAMPGIACYLDGPNITVHMPAGASAIFAPSAWPLRLVRG